MSNDFKVSLGLKTVWQPLLLPVKFINATRSLTEVSVIKNQFKFAIEEISSVKDLITDDTFFFCSIAIESLIKYL